MQSGLSVFRWRGLLFCPSVYSGRFLCTLGRDRLQTLSLQLLQSTPFLPGRRGERQRGREGGRERGTNLAVASIRRENWEIKIPLLLARAAAAAALFDKILPSL